MSPPRPDREAQARHARELLAQGLHLSRVAARVGVSESTLRRRLAGPLPDAGTARLGRPPVFTGDELSGEDVELIRKLTIAATPTGLGLAGRYRTDLAFEKWLMHHAKERCPEELAERITRRNIPDSLKARVTALLNPDAWLHKHGPKSAALRAVAGRRRDSVIMPDGREVALLAGDLWTMDDMHLNIPFCLPCDDPAERAAARWGWRASRAQLIAFFDMRSRRFLGFAIVARKGDAYSGYDILWSMAGMFEDYGLPRLGIYTEHGAWISDLVRASIASVDLEHTVASTARGKRIEGAFNELQAHMAAALVLLQRGREAAGLYTPDFMRLTDQDLGRERGEHEAAKKLWRQLRSGILDPRAAGVLTMDEMVRFVEQEMDAYNSRPHGPRTALAGLSPEALWEREMADAAPLRRLTELDHWRLKPGRSELCIAGNTILCRCDRFTASGWNYGHPQLLAALRGQNVEVRWAAADPTRAALFSRQSGTRQLPRHILAECSPAAVTLNAWTPGQLKSLVQPGDFLGFVELKEDAPVLDLSGRHGRGHFEQAREMREYLRWSRYGFVSLAKARRMRIAEHHDGRGNGLRIEHDAPAQDVLSTAEPVQAISIDPATTREARIAAEAAETGGEPVAPVRALPVPARITRTARAAAPQAPRGPAADRLSAYLDDI